jgi:2-aminoethylphosphonate-pyruvate transaminase
MIKTAVILAAGLGSRFKDKTLDKPKAFIEFIGKPMIIRSIENSIQSGIEKIIIGIGHQSQYFEALQSKYPQIKCCKIDRYSTTGSLFTLYNCRHLIKEDFLLLESDIVYEPKALDFILKTKNTNMVLATSLIKFQDHLFIEMNEQRELVNYSFDKKKLNKIDGDWVGINKMSITTFKKVCKMIKENPSRYEKECYEQVCLIKKFRVGYIPNLLWYEIDCEEDLVAAETIFLENGKSNNAFNETLQIKLS